MIDMALTNYMQCYYVCLNTQTAICIRYNVKFVFCAGALQRVEHSETAVTTDAITCTTCSGTLKGNYCECS